MALPAFPRRLLTRPSVKIPRPLSRITERGTEADMHAAGLREENREAIWRAHKGLYATGMSPGISLALRRQGELFYNRAMGFSRLSDQQQLGVDTPICLFSASKAVTAMLVHHLVERGEVDLEKPLAYYVPEYGVQGKHRTTVMHLLTHRGGVPRIQEDVGPEDLFDVQKVTELMAAAKPDRPGRRQAYHAITAGFVLGSLIEAVTGEDINTLLDTVIREPMGMTNFRFGMESGEPAENVVTGLQLSPVDSYLKYAVGGPLQQVVDVSNDPRFRQIAIPAGNLYATAEEASRFFQMLLNEGRWEGKQIFKPETVRRAISPVKPARLDRTLMLPLQFSPGFMLGQKTVSLYGPGTPQAFGHLGFISIYCWADPQRDLSGALLTTGKGLIGPHLPSLVRLQLVINRNTI